MKQWILSTLAVALCLAVWTSTASATFYYWTNSQTDNDAANLNNWNTAQDNTGTNAPDFDGLDDDLRVDLNGANKAILSSTWATTTVPDDLQIGWDGNTGEMEISGGNNSLDNTLRVGRVGGTGYLTISGGTFSVPNSYTTFGDGGTAIVTMTGGTLNSDRQTWAQGAADSATLNMSGGVMNITLSDASPASSSGSLRMADGNASLNISGTAVINADKLYINAGGVLTQTGGAIHITGALDANSTFDFTEAGIAAMLGQVQFDGGVFDVIGDYESLFDAAIGNGNIYTTVGGVYVDAIYSAGNDLTTLELVVPEPASLALVALGVPFLVRRKK